MARDEVGGRLLDGGDRLQKGRHRVLTVIRLVVADPEGGRGGDSVPVPVGHDDIVRREGGQRGGLVFCKSCGVREQVHRFDLDIFKSALELQCHKVGRAGNIRLNEVVGIGAEGYPHALIPVRLAELVDKGALRLHLVGQRVEPLGCQVDVEVRQAAEVARYYINGQESEDKHRRDGSEYHRAPAFSFNKLHI